MELTCGELVDRLIVVHLKIWHLVEVAEDPSQPDAAVASAARRMQRLNRERVQLKNALNEKLGEAHEEIKLPLPERPLPERPLPERSRREG
jgi:hypothetical protein